MIDADDFEPSEAPDELDGDWRAALELLRVTARAMDGGDFGEGTALSKPFPRIFG